MALHLHLCDRNNPLADAWEQAFQGLPMVTVHLCDFFSVEADVMVCGGNSFGFMDVGLDLAISLKLGWHVQERLQALLHSEHDGVLPVGQAVAVPTDDRRWPLLIAAPAMWVPMDVSESIAPYLAARAALRTFRTLSASENKVWHVLMPGLGTGLGRVQAPVCAQQMRRAYDEVVLGQVPRPASLEEAHERYRAMVAAPAYREEREVEEITEDTGPS